jgi:hypothetical protein
MSTTLLIVAVVCDFMARWVMLEMGTLQNAGESSAALTSSTSTPSRITGWLALFNRWFILPEPRFCSWRSEVVSVLVNVQRRGDVRVRGRCEDQPVAPGGDEPVLQHRGHEARGHGGSRR